MRRILLRTLIAILLAIPTLFSPNSSAKAEDIGPYDLINLVNGIRTGVYGYSELIVDAHLMATAQWTAEEMINQNIKDHLYNHGYPGVAARVKSSGFGGGAHVIATENWAGASTVSWASLSWIQQVWGDPAHLIPMEDGNYTHIGAGVASDGNGFTVYIVHAAYAPGATIDSGSSGSTSVIPSGPTATSNYVVPVFTVTPQSDGSTVHLVRYGQALSTIATWYGVTIAQIKQLNNLSSDAIYEGQSLIIRQAPTATITPTRTATVPQPTRTPRLTSTPRPTLGATLTPTHGTGLKNPLPRIDRQWGGLGLLILSAAGLFAVLYLAFIKPILKKK